MDSIQNGLKHDTFLPLLLNFTLKDAYEGSGKLKGNGSEWNT
jgi:hypothetical protein